MALYFKSNVNYRINISSSSTRNPSVLQAFPPWHTEFPATPTWEGDRWRSPGDSAHGTFRPPSRSSATPHPKPYPLLTRTTIFLAVHPFDPAGESV